MSTREPRARLTFTIPPGTPPVLCRSPKCGRSVYWIVTDTGKRMPVDADGTSHFATCIDAASFRKGKASP